MMNMKNSKIRMIVPYALIAVFLIAGFWMMAKGCRLVSSYNQQIQEAEQALAAADPALADAVEQEAAALQAENEELSQQVQDLQSQNAELEASNTQLQTRLEELTQSEDTAYYQKVLESLTEGMNQVEEYIGNP
jgi:phage shock protein A